MSASPKYLIYHDLIGFNIRVRSKSITSNKEFSDVGMVVDETKNLLIIEKKGMIKKYIKKDNVFRFQLTNKTNDSNNEIELEVNGDEIVGIPENRLRTLRKKKKWMRN
ncbi:MAG: ribonuclease P protein subunit [Promethearchaeota archaeon]